MSATCPHPDAESAIHPECAGCRAHLAQDVTYANQYMGVPIQIEARPSPYESVTYTRGTPARWFGRDRGQADLIAPPVALRDTRSMPHIRMLTLVSETPTLTTFTHPDTSEQVRVATDGTSGAPTGVTYAAASGDVELELIRTADATRSWLGTVDGRTRQVETSGGYPGMTAWALG